MNKCYTRYLGKILWFLILITQAPYPYAEEVIVATGSRQGLYFKMIGEIRDLVKKYGDDKHSLTVIPSEGSLDNLKQIANNKTNVHLGVIQDNIFKSSRSKDITNAENVRYILPLHKEEFHLIVKGDYIRTVMNLKGKKIGVIGDKDSGSYLTADSLFHTSFGMTNTEIISHPSDKPEVVISKLRNNQIDAMFYVVGKPAPIFEKLDFKTENFRLVPIMNPRYAGTTTIEAHTYTGQDTKVDTLYVRAMLVAFNYDKKNRYCDAIRDIVDIVYKHSGWLKQHFAGKWNDVIFGRDVPIGDLKKNRCLHDK